MIADPTLDFFILVKGNSVLHLALRGHFVGNHLKLFDNEEHLQVLVRRVLSACIAVPELEGPLLHVENSGAQMAELKVTEVLAEVIDAFFSEHGFHVVEAITHRYTWYVLLHKELHRTGVVLRKFLIEVGACLEK